MNVILMSERKASLLNKIGHTTKCVTWERLERNSYLKYSIASYRVMVCHSAAICFSKAPFPRRGPGFQVQVLSLLCSVNWMGTSLLKWYSRNAGVTPFTSTMWRVRGISGSVFNHPEKSYHMDGRLPHSQTTLLRQETAKKMAWEECQSASDD